MSRFEECAFPASHALVSAALGGLLCVASSACGSSTGLSTASAVSTGASSSAPEATGSTSSSSSTASSSSAASAQATASTSVDIDTPVPDTECDGGVPANPQITSVTTGALTQDQFATMCANENGIMEIQPHCSGSNACRGMSYWSEEQQLIVHTCRGLNSCAGYSCIVCD